MRRLGASWPHHHACHSRPGPGSCVGPPARQLHIAWDLRQHPPLPTAVPKQEDRHASDTSLHHQHTEAMLSCVNFAAHQLCCAVRTARDLEPGMQQPQCTSEAHTECNEPLKGCQDPHLLSCRRRTSRSGRHGWFCQRGLLAQALAGLHSEWSCDLPCVKCEGGFLYHQWASSSHGFIPLHPFAELS